MADADVQMIRGTERAEALVCEAARNDYRSDGIIHHTFRDVMAGAAIDRHIANEVFGGVAQSPAEWSETLYQTLVTRARKRTLLKHLMSNGHWGPFEHPQATLALEGVTRVAMAQITRHRHFTFDIMSLRYVDVECGKSNRVLHQFQMPEAVTDGEVVSREGVVELDDPTECRRIYADAYRDAVDHYRRLLDQGMPPEEARKVLPMGIKVNIVMSGNARAWMHLLNIRGKANVQREARELADSIYEALRRWMPETFRLFDEKQPMQLTP